MVNTAASIRQPMVVRAFGAAAAGPIPMPAPPGGVLKGDLVAGVWNISTLQSAAASFESTVSVSGQIQQTAAANLSAAEFWFVIIPAS